MSRLLNSGRGPALIACSLVLAAAIGGTAIAATSGGGPSPRPSKARAATTRRTIDKQVHKIAPRLHVAFAKNANNAARSAMAVNSESVRKSGVITASVGQRVPVLKLGPFTFTLACRVGSATAAPPEGSVVGEIDLSSSEDKTAIESSSTSQAAEFPLGAQFPLTDLSTSTHPTGASPVPDEPNFDGDGGFFTALAPSGAVVSGNAYVGTHIQGHDCVGGVFLLN
jgi:hypothetical protein